MFKIIVQDKTLRIMSAFMLAAVVIASAMALQIYRLAQKEVIILGLCIVLGFVLFREIGKRYRVIKEYSEPVRRHKEPNRRAAGGYRRRGHTDDFL